MAAEERDPHRDPLSDESGSHPVGTGVGAAGGAVAGAAAGMSGGPLGMAAGGVVGAVVGSVAGRAAAEAIHPTAPTAYGPERIASPPHETTSPPVGHTTWEYEDEVILRPDTYPDSSQAMAPAPRAAPSPAPTLVTPAASTTPDLPAAGAASETSDHRRDALDVLQDLLACCTDSVSSYRSWAEHARREDLRAIFTQRMHDCQRGAMDLQDQIHRLGGEVRDGSSARDALHRGWVAVKSTLAAGDDSARLEQAERSEDHALTRYRAALQQPMPEAVRSLVERQLRAVQRHHDQIRSLRERLRAAN